MGNLKSSHGMAALGGENDALVEGGTMALEDSVNQEIDEPVLMRESVKLGPFQTEILEGKTRAQLGKSAHMMIMPFKAGEAQQSGA